MPVVVLYSVITHTSTWFLDREIYQLVIAVTALKTCAIECNRSIKQFPI